VNVLDYALLYANAGYLVFPCKPGSKEPATFNGFKDASADPDEVRQMFAPNPMFNIGLRCGPQPNGINLLALDVDPKNGGLESWEALNKISPINGTARHETPHGGFHVFFNAPEGFSPTGQNKLGPGVDTRGEKGYVVVPPSVLADGRYRANLAQALARNAADLLPEGLQRALEAPRSPAPAPKARRPPSFASDDSPANWVRHNLDWWTYLIKHGWTHDRGEYWVRPGKTAREGKGAQLHDEHLVIYTSSIPPQLEGLGSLNADGFSISVPLFDFITAYEFGGDRSACASYVRRELMPKLPPRPGLVRATPPDGDGTAPTMNLPESFWQARPILGHIRQAAWSRHTSPDALLVHAIARSATLIPPSLKLPPIVGTFATFDFLGCVVAETSGGKSVAGGVAKDLVPDPQLMLSAGERTIMFDRPIGSGEGIPQAFMIPEVREDADGKRKATGRQVVGKQALHLVVDESTALVAQAQRRGTTIIQTLLSAWSGQTLGQQNASAETLRIVDGGRCRVAAVLNMQSSNAWMLFTEEMATMGLTSRLLFASAHDPASPDEEPSWPGMMSFPIPPSLTSAVETMTYDPAIAAEIRAERRAVLRGGVSDKATGHYTLLRCKVASVFAVWEGSKFVDLSSWELAGQVLDASVTVLRHLETLRSCQLRDQRHQQAELRGESEAIAESAKSRRRVSELSRRVADRTGKEGIGRRDLMRALTAAKNRHLFDLALEKAIADGYVILRDGRIYPA